jgi:SAM-dependent methyltransferase
MMWCMDGHGGATYDGIGGNYSWHRRSDPRLGSQIRRAIGDAETLINVGAGTGSYEPTDLAVVAVEPSAVMLAQRPPGSAPAVQACAEQLPFGDATFGAALAIFTVHHWTAPAAGLAELCRVARRVVILSFDPAIHFSYWLVREYLPEMATLPSAAVEPVDGIAEAVGATRVEPVLVPADCVDGFNWAYWRRPEAYLDPAVRACISGLAQLPPDLVAARMEQLRDDVADGTWLRRHADLLRLEAVDAGLRLIVRDPG